jgi:hypothetical protein
MTSQKRRWMEWNALRWAEGNRKLLKAQIGGRWGGGSGKRMHTYILEALRDNQVRYAALRHRADDLVVKWGRRKVSRLSAKKQKAREDTVATKILLKTFLISGKMWTTQPRRTLNSF